jgi:hypothetical protein
VGDIPSPAQDLQITSAHRKSVSFEQKFKLVRLNAMDRLGPDLPSRDKLTPDSLGSPHCHSSLISIQ